MPSSSCFVKDVFGFDVGGKTGTAKKNFYWEYSNKKLNTFISVFPMYKPKYVLLVLLDEPKPAPELVYNYRGQKITTKRNESGWNSVYARCPLGTLPKDSNNK